MTASDDLAIDGWNDAREIRQAICLLTEAQKAMPETGHKTKEDLINEARTLIERLVAVKHKLRENECEFVLSLDEKLKRYGYGAFVSARQLFWLRDLEGRYAPDERQMDLLG